MIPKTRIAPARWLIPAFACALAHSLPAQEANPNAAKNSNTQVVAESEKPADEAVILEDFVVTGTQLRGVEPIGSSVINLSPAKVATTGATSSSEILRSVPQVTNIFNSDPNVFINAAANQNQVIRPNLRNLPSGLGSGATTLVLIDGTRVAGVGVSTYAVDPDTLPIGALENVEISTDGGSAVYGADAIGGVINYVSRRHFGGTRLDARYAVADKYFKTDVNLTTGKDWGKGSAYISLSYSKNDSILNGDRSYAKRLDYSGSSIVPTGLQTNLPNIQGPSVFDFATLTFKPGANYAMPGLVPNTYNRVDEIQWGALTPSAERKGLFAGFNQKLSDKVTVDARAFYSKREMFSPRGPTGANASVPSTNPFYIPLPAPNSPTATETVMFSFAPLLGYNTSYQTSDFNIWGATANVTADLNDNWQLRTTLHHSKSNTHYFLTDVNPTLLTNYAAGTTTNTAINPYNIVATPNKQLITDILNYETAGEGKDGLTDLRAVVDGKLATLRGGKIRAAVGAEYVKDEFQQRFGSGVVGNVNTLPFKTYDRNVKSLFAEVALPVFGRTNAQPGLQSLLLSAAWRYDKYNDFGSTKNPKLGLTYKPADWITLRGNWSKSFNAPTPIDQLGSAQNSLTIVPFVAALKPGDTAAPGSWTIALQGSNPNLKPQTSTNYTYGFDIKPKALEGLTLSASYYHIFFRGQLSKAPVFNAQQLFTNFPTFVTLRPTAAQISAFAQQAANTGGPAQVAGFLSGSPPVYELIDFRTTNLGNTALAGLDFSAQYRHPTSWGAFDASIGGNYQLKSETQLSDLAPFTDDLATGVSVFRLRTTFGVDYKKLRAQLTWNQTRGYALLRTANLPQDRLEAFHLLNLYFKYDLSTEGILKNTSVSLNIDNILDSNPPVYKNTGSNGYAGGFTQGRMFMLGLTKQF